LNLNSNIFEMLVLSLRYLCIILISKVHPFHVGVCEIFHNSDTQSLEISMKFFIDDFEVALQQNGYSDYILNDSSDAEFINQYLKNRFIITVNKQKLSLKMVGFEIQEDAVLCYLEVKNIKEISQVEILNSVMMELFEDQINLTHFQYKGNMKSIQATKDQPTGTIDTSTW